MCEARKGLETEFPAGQKDVKFVKVFAVEKNQTRHNCLESAMRNLAETSTLDVCCFYVCQERLHKFLYNPSSLHFWSGCVLYLCYTGLTVVNNKSGLLLLGGYFSCCFITQVYSFRILVSLRCPVKTVKVPLQLWGSCGFRSTELTQGKNHKHNRTLVTAKSMLAEKTTSAVPRVKCTRERDTNYNRWYSVCNVVLLFKYI